MTVKNVWMAFVLGAAVAACSKDTSGVTTTLPPLAGLRYFDAVTDTTYLDFRVVDIVQYAPNTWAASFRTGGNPQGVTTTHSPPFLPVQAGTRHIKVFLDSTDLATATTVMFDTTVSLTEGHNYTFILYGSAQAGTIHALVLDDTDQPLPTDGNSTVWVRTLNLAADTTGLGVPDVFITDQAAPAGSPTFAGPAYLALSAYQRIATGALSAMLTRSGTLTPVTVSATLPAGVVGTSTVDPIAGALAQNTGMTVVILPRSTPGANVPTTYANPGIVILIDQQPPRTAS
jgi:hypothetical protein